MGLFDYNHRREVRHFLCSWNNNAVAVTPEPSSLFPSDSAGSRLTWSRTLLEAKTRVVFEHPALCFAKVKRGGPVPLASHPDLTSLLHEKSGNPNWPDRAGLSNSSASAWSERPRCFGIARRPDGPTPRRRTDRQSRASGLLIAVQGPYGLWRSRKGLGRIGDGGLSRQSQGSSRGLDRVHDR